METLAVTRGLEILTGKLYIFIAKMTGEQGSLWSLPAALTSCCFMMMGIASSLGS